VQLLLARVPCGLHGHATREYRCTGGIIQRYLGRISGPLLDRIDLHIEVPAIAYQELRARPAIVQKVVPEKPSVSSEVVVVAPAIGLAYGKGSSSSASAPLLRIADRRQSGQAPAIAFPCPTAPGRRRRPGTRGWRFPRREASGAQQAINERRTRARVSHTSTIFSTPDRVWTYVRRTRVDFRHRA
jgi:hypothetical protein